MRTRIFATAATTVGLALAAPAVAGAAVVTVTGDGLNPTPLSPGVTPTIKNMELGIGVAVAGSEAAGYTIRALAPDAAPVGTHSDWCWNIPISDALQYRGNGTYRLAVQEYTDINCTKPGRLLSYSWVVAAGVSIAQPQNVLPTRRPNSFVTNVQQLDFLGNKGADGYEVRYARRGAIGPDGGIAGASSPGIVNGNKVDLRLDRPGTYTVVARAMRGVFSSPWSAPIHVTMVAPFDLETTSFPDSRGPRYRVRGVIREKSARGKVTVSLAKGRHGKRFHRLGRAKIRKHGVFSLRFRIRKVGVYRLRYSYRGSKTVLPGRATETIRIRRHRFFT